MKTRGKIFRQALELVTQCMLMPGVELNIEEVVCFYKNNLERFGTTVKRLTTRRTQAVDI